MFGLFDNDRYNSKNIESDEIREKYVFKLPQWLLYGLVGFTAVRLYGYLFNCYRVPLDPVFNAFWGVWLLLMAVPIAMGFVNYYLHKDDPETVKPWQISMIVVLGVVAIVLYCATALMQGVCK